MYLLHNGHNNSNSFLHFWWGFNKIGNIKQNVWHTLFAINITIVSIVIFIITKLYDFSSGVRKFSTLPLFLGLQLQTFFILTFFCACGSQTFACISVTSMAWKRHRLLDSVPRVFDSKVWGGSKIAFLTFFQIVMMLLVRDHTLSTDVLNQGWQTFSMKHHIRNISKAALDNM